MNALDKEGSSPLQRERRLSLGESLDGCFLQSSTVRIDALHLTALTALSGNWYRVATSTRWQLVRSSVT